MNLAMPNTDLNTVIATKVFFHELRWAGIPARFSDYCSDTEVPTRVVGELEVGQHMLRFTRDWCYARVAVLPAFPIDLAKKVNDAALSSVERTKYSGLDGGLGTVARANGHAGGISSREICDPIRAYHIDTAEGLKAFTETLFQLFPETKKPDCGFTIEPVRPHHYEALAHARKTGDLRAVVAGYNSIVALCPTQEIAEVLLDCFLDK